MAEASQVIFGKPTSGSQGEGIGELGHGSVVEGWKATEDSIDRISREHRQFFCKIWAATSVVPTMDLRESFPMLLNNRLNSSILIAEV